MVASNAGMGWRRAHKGGKPKGALGVLGALGALGPGVLASWRPVPCARLCHPVHAMASRRVSIARTRAVMAQHGVDEMEWWPGYLVRHLEAGVAGVVPR